MCTFLLRIGASWDMGLVCCGICEMSLCSYLGKYKHHIILDHIPMIPICIRTRHQNGIINVHITVKLRFLVIEVMWHSTWLLNNLLATQCYTTRNNRMFLALFNKTNRWLVSWGFSPLRCPKVTLCCAISSMKKKHQPLGICPGELYLPESFVVCATVSPLIIS